MSLSQEDKWAQCVVIQLFYTSKMGGWGVSVQENAKDVV